MKTKIEQLEELLAELKSQTSELPGSGRELVTHAKSHPLPYAITGLGLACTIGQALKTAFRKPPAPPTFKERVADAAHTAREKASHLAESARDHASHLAETARDRIHDASDAIGEKAGSVRTQVSRRADSSTSASEKIRNLVEERPFVTAAGVIATGFVAGLLIPPTRAERDWFGDRGRQIIDDAKEAGREAVEEGKAVVKETIAAADHAVREAAEDTEAAIRQKLAGADKVVRDAAKDVDESIRGAANDLDKKVRDAARDTGEAVRDKLSEV